MGTNTKNLNFVTPMPQEEDVDKGPSIKSSGLRSILNKYTVIVNKHFVLRTEAWFQLVLKEGLGIDNFWLRYEFAKSRGAIHFHALLYAMDKSMDIRKLMDYVLQATKISEINTFEDITAEKLTSLIKKTFTDITALHPAGRERSTSNIPCNTPWYVQRCKVANGQENNIKVINHMVIGDDVTSLMVGNVDEWPGHERGGNYIITGNQSFKNTFIFDST